MGPGSTLDVDQCFHQKVAYRSFQDHVSQWPKFTANSLTLHHVSVDMVSLPRTKSLRKFLSSFQARLAEVKHTSHRSCGVAFPGSMKPYFTGQVLVQATAENTYHMMHSTELTKQGELKLVPCLSGYLISSLSCDFIIHVTHTINSNRNTVTGQFLPKKSHWLYT